LGYTSTFVIDDLTDFDPSVPSPPLISLMNVKKCIRADGLFNRDTYNQVN